MSTSNMKNPLAFYEFASAKFEPWWCIGIQLLFTYLFFIMFIQHHTEDSKSPDQIIEI